ATATPVPSAIASVLSVSVSSASDSPVSASSAPVSSAPGFSDVSELTCSSRVESHGRPRRGVGEIGRFVTAVGAAEDPAVVESVLLALPEFDLEDMDPEPTPMLGPRDVPTLELGLGGVVFGLHLLPVGHRLGLLGHGRTDLRAAGAHSEVGVRVLGGGRLAAAADADLAFHVLPREAHGGAGIVAQLLALGRVIVGEEEEAAFIDAFEQDDA